MSISGGCAIGWFCLIQDHWLNGSAYLERPTVPPNPFVSLDTLFPLKLLPPSAAPASGLTTLPRGASPRLFTQLWTHTFSICPTERKVLLFYSSYHNTCDYIFKLWDMQQAHQNLFAKKGLEACGSSVQTRQAWGRTQSEGREGPALASAVPRGWSHSLTGSHPSIVPVLCLPLPSPLFKDNGENLFKQEVGQGIKFCSLRISP